MTQTRSCSPYRIIVRGPNHLGDNILAEPVYQALRKAYPDSFITLMVPEGLRDLFSRELFDSFHYFPRDALKTVRGFQDLLRRVKREHYTLSLHFPFSIGGRLLFWAAGISERVGFYQGVAWGFTQGVKWRGRASGLSKAQHYAQLLEQALGLPPGVPEIALPIRRAQSSSRILVAPGASLDLRVWPYFEQLLLQLNAQRVPVTVVGGKAEKRWDPWLAQFPDIENQIGRTTLPDLRRMVRDAGAVVANDSGIAHLAAREGVPTLVLFGPGDPQYVLPSGAKVRGLLPQGIECAPCEKTRCAAPQGYQACLKSISVERVLEELFQVLPKLT